MNIRKINEIFGYGLFTVGALKIILIILVIIKVANNIAVIFNGGSVNSEYYPALSTTIGFAQLILAIGSIIMIIVNIKKQPGVIIGYLWGLGALLIELITPSMLSFYAVFVECGMYMKAGTKIRKQNVGSDKNYRKIKQNIKNTEWFYSEQNKTYNEKEQIGNQSNYEYDEIKEVEEPEIEEDLNEIDKKENSIKENMVTILLVSLILIILFGVGVLVYIITSNFDNNKVEIPKIPENITITNNNNTIAEKQENNKETIETIPAKENDTKYSTLSKIANIFNDCNASKKMRLQGYTMRAIATGNKITVFSSGDGLEFNVEFILDNNILHTEVIYNETDPRITGIKVTLGVVLVDCVGQVKGYSDGTVSKVLGEDIALNYTIENEGVEIRKLDNSNNIVIKVDLNSNFSFLDKY